MRIILLLTLMTGSLLAQCGQYEPKRVTKEGITYELWKTQLDQYSRPQTQLDVLSTDNEVNAFRVVVKYQLLVVADKPPVIAEVWLVLPFHKVQYGIGIIQRSPAIGWLPMDVSAICSISIQEQKPARTVEF